LLTGLYPNSTGIYGNAQIFRQTIPSHVSLPQLFRHHGYLTARLGKLYHYGVPGSIGTDGHDDPASWEMEFNPAGVDLLEEEPQIFSLAKGNYGSALSWYASQNDDEKHTDGILAIDAEWVLERCAKTPQRPFFMAVGFFRPHTPFIAPSVPYYDWHPRENIPLVQGVAEDQQDIPAPALASRKPEEEKLTEELSRQAIQAYYASISFMDAQVGRVVETLERLGLAKNTIIVFTSDHGYHLGEHGLWKKQSIFEESARVPLLIVAPGVSHEASVVETPVSHVDLYPTLAELCKLDPPENLQGQSLIPLMEDPTESGRGWALTQVNRGAGSVRMSQPAEDKRKGITGYSLRTLRWRYTEWNDGQQGSELYDHSADPKEITNLADNPQYAATVAELSAQLRQAAASTFPASGSPPELQPGLWSPELRVGSKSSKSAKSDRRNKAE
jgi:iduronate 2-sulfatase